MSKFRYLQVVTDYTRVHDAVCEVTHPAPYKFFVTVLGPSGLGVGIFERRDSIEQALCLYLSALRELIHVYDANEHR